MSEFTREDVQAWIDSLGERETEMLAHVVGEAEFRAACETLRESAEHCAKLAVRLANEDRKTRSKAVRMVVGVLLSLLRDAEHAAAELSGQLPASSRIVRLQ